MRTRGKYFWKEKFYSFCSIHHEHKDDCPMCNFGEWHNVIWTKVSDKLFKWFPRLWVFFANL